MHKKDQGKLGEALVIAQCLDNGVEVFTDFGDNSKIDVILNTATGLVKVQVKCCGRETTSPASARLYLTKSGPNYRFKYTVDQIDYFAVVDMLTKRIAWVKVTPELMMGNSILLRIDPAKHEYKNTQWFSSFEQFPFGPIAQ